MESSNDFVTIAAAFGAAVYAALGLDYIAIARLGLPLQAVARGATLVALLIGIFIAIEFLSRKLGKAE